MAFTVHTRYARGDNHVQQEFSRDLKEITTTLMCIKRNKTSSHLFHYESTEKCTQTIKEIAESKVTIFL